MGQAGVEDKGIAPHLKDRSPTSQLTLQWSALPLNPVQHHERSLLSSAWCLSTGPGRGSLMTQGPQLSSMLGTILAPDILFTPQKADPGQYWGLEEPPTFSPAQIRMPGPAQARRAHIVTAGHRPGPTRHEACPTPPGIRAGWR